MEVMLGSLSYCSTTFLRTSHGEEQLGQSVTELIQKANVDMEPLDVISQTTIPEDCDIIFINGPVTDISADEQ